MTVPIERAPSMDLRAVIVDDEPLASEGIRLVLVDGAPAGHAASGVRVEIVASCASGREAMVVLPALHPDILFLDVQMPEIDGFGVLERLEPEDVPPAVIFVTAYDEHALRAFDASALDYVLKPLAPARLWDAVARSAQRVREMRALQATLAAREDVAPSGTGRYLQRIVVRDLRGTHVVDVDAVEWIAGESSYVRLHSAGRTLLLRERMHVLERQLDPARFFRSHRSAIVRIDLIREIVALSRYEHAVLLGTGARAPLSRDRRSRLEALLRESR